MTLSALIYIIPQFYPGIDNEWLFKIGIDIVTFLSREEIVRFEHRVASETAARPSLGQMFLGAGPHRLVEQVSAIVAEIDRSGKISVDDPRVAAEQFVSMCKGLGEVRARFGQPESSSEQARRVENAVTAFLAAYS